MFNNLFKRIGHRDQRSPEDRFFSNVVGYADIKTLLLKSMVSKDPVRILLSGPPSSSKTVFLLEMLKGLNDVYFVDGAAASAAGMRDYLFKNNTKYLLIDEIDKMKKTDQAALLNVMETGILCETKLNGKIRQRRIKLWMFATSNDVSRLSQALRSRFMELHLREYVYEDFIEIVRRVLKAKYQMNEKISEKIAYAVWN